MNSDPFIPHSKQTLKSLTVIFGDLAVQTWEQDAIHAEAVWGFEDRLTVTRRPIVSEEGEMELHSAVILMLLLIVCAENEIGHIIFPGQYF